MPLDNDDESLTNNLLSIFYFRIESKSAAFSEKRLLLTKVKVNQKVRICLRWKCMFDFFVWGLRGNITEIMLI